MWKNHSHSLLKTKSLLHMCKIQREKISLASLWTLMTGRIEFFIDPLCIHLLSNHIIYFCLFLLL